MSQTTMPSAVPSRLNERIHECLDAMHDGDERMDMPDAERNICRTTNALRDLLNLCIDMRYGNVDDAAARIPAVIANAIDVREEATR